MAITYTPLAYFRSVYQETHARRMEQALADARAEASTTAAAAAQKVKLYQSLIEGELRIAKGFADAAKGGGLDATLGQLIAADRGLSYDASQESIQQAKLQQKAAEMALSGLQLPASARKGYIEDAGILAEQLQSLAVNDPAEAARQIRASGLVARMKGESGGQRVEAVSRAYAEMVAKGLPPEVVGPALAAGAGEVRALTAAEYETFVNESVASAVAGVPGIGAERADQQRLIKVLKDASVTGRSLQEQWELSTGEPLPERYRAASTPTAADTGLADSLARIAEYRRRAEGAVAEATVGAPDVYRRAGELYAPVAPSRIPAAAQSTRPLPTAAQAQRAATTGRPIPPPRNVADILAARSLSTERVSQGYAPVAPPRTAAPVSTQAAATARALKAAAALTTSGAWQAPPTPMRPVVDGVVAEVELGRVKPAEVYGTLVRDLGEAAAEEAYSYVIATLRNKARAPKVAPVTLAPRGDVSTTGADVGE